jgi:hypothetical protein
MATTSTQASVRAADNAIEAQTKAQIQTQISRLEDRLRIASNGLVRLNPNVQGNQVIIARYKNEVATIPGEISALKAQLTPVSKPTTRKSGIVAQTTVRAGIIVEANPPTSVNTPESGQPSTPTTENYCKAFDFTNARRSHVCDFILEMKKDIDLSKYTKAIANTIREAVRKLLALLGGTDTSGVTTFLINTLKNIARELRDFNKYILKPITDFAKTVIAYIATLRSIIAWILSLPAKLAQLLSDCLVRLRKLIASVFTSIVAVGSGADPNAGDVESQAGGFYGDSGFADVIAQAKDATAAVTETLTAVQETTTAVAGVGITAIALFSPATAEEANSASSQALDAMLQQNLSDAASAVTEPFTRIPNLF